MFKCLWFASNICWTANPREPIKDEYSTHEDIDNEENTIMIWALKHHIDTVYRKEITKGNPDDTKDEESNSFLTTKGSFSTIRENTNNTCNGNISNFPIKIPLLNFESIKNMNYDSEKEVYNNMEDKLKKIKKRFDYIKEMK